MLVSSLTSRRQSDAMQHALDEIWAHPQPRAELVEVIDLLRGRSEHLQLPLKEDGDTPLHVHARYTRTEILAALGVGSGAKAAPPGRQASGGTPRLRPMSSPLRWTRAWADFRRRRDIATTPSARNSSTGRARGPRPQLRVIGERYIHHAEKGTNILLFGRLRSDDRAFWCLGRAAYVKHEGERPIAFVWNLDHRLPADLYAEFAAAVPKSSFLQPFTDRRCSG